MSAQRRHLRCHRGDMDPARLVLLLVAAATLAFSACFLPGGVNASCGDRFGGPCEDGLICSESSNFSCQRPPPATGYGSGEARCTSDSWCAHGEHCVDGTCGSDRCVSDLD